MIIITFIFALINLACGGVMIKAPCPDVQVVENFNMTQFCQDNWYQIARYPNDIENNGDCVTMGLQMDNNVCKLNTTEVIGGKLNLIEGYVSFPNGDANGVININSQKIVDEGGVDHFLPVHVLVVDYDNFMFTYKCNYNEATKLRHDYAWVWSRSRKMNSNARAQLDKVLQLHNYINKNILTWDHFDKEYCTINK